MTPTAIMADMALPEMMCWIGLCAVCVFFSGLFSGAETGMYCINTTRVRLAAHQKSAAAIRMQLLLRDRGGLLFTTLFGTNLANYLAPACLTIIFLSTIADHTREETESLAELYTTLILTPIVFVLGEVVPKNVFNRNAEALMLRFSGIIFLAHRICEKLGIIWLQRKFSEIAFRGMNPNARDTAGVKSRLDVFQMLREGAAEGTMSLTQMSILERIDRLRSLQVSAVMVPHYQVVMLAADDTRKSAEPLLRLSRVSRLPVYGDDKRNVVGVVHVLDLLTAGGDRTARNLMRPPIEISPQTRVVDALSRLQREFRRMAIVVDSKRRCLGIVTVKDLVEEIVGELKAW
ncbi:MAG: DUF21 domain-containing protein [Phycisphaerae bacterium]|nr:DUF21 domain-containing protein [Phycisphaerae bacterium]